MDRTKLIGIALLVIVLGVGFIAFQFYSENQTLNNENQTLKRERARLLEETRALQSRYNEADRERGELRARWSRIQEELTRLQAERDDFAKKYESVSAERDMLVEELKKVPSRAAAPREMPMARRPMVREAPMAVTSEDYWSDVVSAKAELEARLIELDKEFAASNMRIAELDKQNKELSLRTDELSKERGMLEAEMRLKERTMNIMSRDLVSERESRKEMTQDLNMMRDDNVRLKRELIVANKEKLTLQKGISLETAKKEDLEQRIFEIESILKEKSMALNELQESLSRALTGERMVVTREAAAVELPPIVVKPEPGMVALEGEVIAVIPEERVVVIDRGEAAGARPGIPLRVVRAGREIGTVEIIETRREVAAADILEVVQGATIQEGDKVISR
ncbi:MAG: hypothetical protein JSW17_06625 [Candidatus Omnitrophota bacterium]|nr:MAG: hypothetical protein JSW17_06625 [Candidatus Omnitrophota bacterium]